MQAILPWQGLYLIGERPSSGGSESAAPRGGSRRLGQGTAPSSAAGAPGADNSGRFVEFELAIQVGRGDGWSSGWQADGVQERLYGRRLGEGGDHLHPTRASGADGDVVLKDPSQKLGPGNAMNTAPSGVGVLTTFGLRQGAGPRYDLGPIRRGWRQHPMVAHQVEPRWRHESSQFFQQFLG